MQQMNVLIIGAGVAGLACASLLQRQGVYPVIVEREPEKTFNTGGYMLGMLPLGGRVLNQLDVREAYHARSIEMQRYEAHRGDGSLVKSYDVDFINQDYGSYRGISRVELISILLDSMDTSKLRYGLSVKALQQQGNQVEVVFSDGREEAFDLVIAADGLHSATRKQVLSWDEYAYYDTHWGGWCAWLNEEMEPVYHEYWSAGGFMGLYPVKDRVGVFLGGPNEHIQKLGLKAFVAQERQKLADQNPFLHRALDALAEAPNPFYWEFHDCRSKQWVKGNIVLLGDAASGFLPTAGVGASMAMDSAAALVDELSRFDLAHLHYALKLYVKRQQKRVEKTQQDSRNLGKMMFVKSPIVASMRNFAMRFYSLKALVKNITHTMEGV